MRALLSARLRGAIGGEAGRAEQDEAKPTPSLSDAELLKLFRQTDEENSHHSPKWQIVETPADTMKPRTITTSDPGDFVVGAFTCTLKFLDPVRDKTNTSTFEFFSAHIICHNDESGAVFAAWTSPCGYATPRSYGDLLIEKQKSGKPIVRMDEGRDPDVDELRTVAEVYADAATRWLIGRASLDLGVPTDRDGVHKAVVTHLEITCVK
jgi:hypothetical protein